VADQIERQHGDVSMLLDLRIDHLGSLDVDLALERIDERVQRLDSVDSLGQRRIEVRRVRGHDLEIATRIALPPAVERSPLHRDDRLRRIAAGLGLALGTHQVAQQQRREKQHHSSSNVRLNSVRSMSDRSAATKSGGSSNGWSRWISP
jgi:hypothetical protein